ncbi:hypothetical protein BS47DRAFT_1341195 [Hydnum rufescens UP504]|uniref:ER membrane protein complex subunit 4 n=1 Tax=Hydnum rufescens UP504 TaxID=1448309 RepID=A0A9P6B232_9AGAM|nr:hypothetical protein BS47DRAFT_1341195 [Hydnum rufescens UP504]
MPIHLNYTQATPPSKSLSNPPGFTNAALTKKVIGTSASTAESYAKLKGKRAWELAISPAKSLPMNAFMLYMSGGGVQIFSIGILAMLLLNPIKAVSTINNAFAPYTPSASDSTRSSLLLPKLTYIACNILTLALGVYKCHSMGLLPTGSADWLNFETRGYSPEISL